MSSISLLRTPRVKSNQVSACCLRDAWAAWGRVRGCTWVALDNIPHHSQHSGASHCHSNVCHSTASHSSRSKSCRPGVHHRCYRWNKPGARVYRSQPFPHRWLGLLPSWSVCSSNRTRGESPDNNRQSTGVPDPSSGPSKHQLQEKPFLQAWQCRMDPPVKRKCSASFYPTNVFRPMYNNTTLFPAWKSLGENNCSFHLILLQFLQNRLSKSHQ